MLIKKVSDIIFTVDKKKALNNGDRSLCGLCGKKDYTLT